MEKKNVKLFRQITSLLLCLAIILPTTIMAVGAAEPVYVDEPLATIYVASDFQFKSSNTTGSTGSNDFDGGVAAMRAIVGKIKDYYTNMDGAIFLGDHTIEYDATTTKQGLDHVQSVLNSAWGLTDEEIIHVQGNHDKVVAGIDTTGGHEFEHYSVFVLNNNDFPWGQGNSDTAEATVKATANQLEAFLKNKVDKNDNKPVFIASHVPLHYSRRSTSTVNRDNIYSKHIFDVLNKYGESLNIIFMFGHNHSSSYDDYIGGAAIYLPAGEDIYIPVKNQASYTTEKLNFTYMNGGYVGFYAGACETNLSSSVIEIYDNRIEVARYDKDGEANLKDKGVVSDTYVTTANTTVYTNDSAEAAIARNNVDVHLDYGALSNKKMYKGGQAVLTVKGEYNTDYSVVWSSSNSSVASVTPTSDGMCAVVSGNAKGTATITATVTEMGRERAANDVTVLQCTDVQVLDKVSTDPEVLIPSGTHTYYKRVSSITDGKEYAFVDMENDGYTVGRQMAIQYTGAADAKENDKVSDDTYNYPDNEFNACPVDVFKLPINGAETTLVNVGSDCSWKAEPDAYDGKNWAFYRDLSNNKKRYLYVTENEANAQKYDLDQDRLRAKSSKPSGFWTFNDSSYGIRSSRIGTGYKYALFYDQAKMDFSVYRTDNNSTNNPNQVNETVNSRVYAFEKVSVTINSDITAYISDTVGYVNKDVGYDDIDGKRLGGAQTGDNIVINDGAKEIKVPLTIDMLSGDFDVTKPGVYGGLTINYAGKTIAENSYTLVVNDTATILKNDAAREYMDNIYVLTDTMVPGKQYLITDTGEAGIGHAMGISRSQVFAYNVLAQEIPVNGKDQVFIDSSRYSYGENTQATSADITESNLVGRGITDQGDINEFMRDTYADRVQYQYAIRLVWSPTQLVYAKSTGNTAHKSGDNAYSFLESNMQAAGYADKRWLSIKKNAVDNQLILLNAPNTGTHDNISISDWWYRWKYDNGIQLNFSQGITCSYLFYNFQNMIKTYEKDANGSNIQTEEGNIARHNDPANKNFQTANNTTIAPERNNHEIRRTWVYERVTDIDTISAWISDNAATVTQRVEGKYTSTKGTTFTGDYVLVDTTKADGTVTTKQVPMTISMLSGAYDLTKPGTYPNLTVTYQGVELSSDYTLTVRRFVENNYPEFPDEGAVRITKYLDTTHYNYVDTGVAAIDLSVTGIPAQSGVDLVIMLDTSSSMENCVHAVGIGKECTQCGGTITEATTRLAVLEATLEDMLIALKEPVNGYVPDIDVAIADFNGYTPINTDYCVQSPNSNIEMNQQVTEDKHDASTVLVPFTDIENVNIKSLNADDDTVDIQNNPGTNYDRAMELTYDLLYEKQVQNSLNGVARRPVVVFMSDGVPYQYNYFCGAANQTNWNNYLAGTLTAGDTAVTSQGDVVVNAFNDYYNGGNGNGNKHWMAEAIKADPNTVNKVIDPDAMTRNHISYVNGLGATMYTIGFGLARDTRIELETLVSVMKNIATDEDHYISVDNNEDLATAFDQIANMIRESSAKDAVFKDQMGPEFDLVTSNNINAKKTDGSIKTVQLGTPGITVKQYDLYKRGEIGTVVNGKTVTEVMVGERKDTEPKVIENVTFNNDGSEVYSNKKSGNILNGKVIEATTFFYNTDTENAHDITVNGKTISLEPETFYWLVGDIPENELVMTYFVYLTGSMEGTRPAGIYDTNTYAKLNYVNYLGNACEQSVPTPKLPWEKAIVGYAFYLVDKNGNPIVNRVTGELGSFERSVEIIEPVYTEFLMNAVTQTISAEDAASDSLPAGYTLFDKDAEYRVSVNSNGKGTYGVDKGVERATTYVQGIEAADINPVGNKEADNYATANTVVWFAVYAEPTVRPDSVVIDYGIPVDIHVLKNDVHMNTDYSVLTGIGAETTDSFTAELTDGYGVIYEGKFGTAKIVDSGVNDTSLATIRYTLNTTTGMQMDATEKFSYAVKYYGPYGKVGYYYSTVTVIPAANMYYEESFLNFEDSTVADDTYGKWQYDVTVSCYNTGNWDEMYAYCKEDSGPAGTWPGVKMEDKDDDNIYTAIVSSDQIGKPVLFNNGDKKYQTGDLTIAGNNIVYKADGSWTPYAGVSSSPKTVYFNNTDGWDLVKAYYWGSTGDNTWPGTEMEYDSVKKLYYIEVPGDYTNIIFNNIYDKDNQPDKIQTGNLSVIDNAIFKPDGTFTLNDDGSTDKTIYFDPAEVPWSEVNAYWWNAEEDNDWPGTKMNYNEKSGLYYITVPKDMTNIIFSNNRPGEGKNLGQIIITDTNKVYRENRWEYGSDTIEVVFDNTTSAWDSVYAYYWSYGDTGMSSWPGIKMTPGDDNLWHLDIPVNAEYIIFNSGPTTMIQTHDITIESPGTVYYPDGHVENNSTADKVYYYKGSKWDKVFAHVWDQNGNALATWPGTEMTYNEETGLYSISVPYNMHNVVFNNGGNGAQTGDLLLPMSGSIYHGDIWTDYDGDSSIQDEDRPGISEDALDGIDADNVYGYDSAYDNCTTYSLGSAPMVTVNAKTGMKNVAPQAYFTFTGTGFDVVSLTDNRSGAVMVEVYPENEDGTLGTRVRSTIVTNYYGYTYENGKWVVKEDASDCLYQVPVVKESGLPYGTYKVIIRAAYLKTLDAQKKGSYSIWLDAIRTYNPAVNDDTAKNTYISDNEANPSFLMIRDILVNQDSFGSGDVTGAVFIDGFVAGGDTVPVIGQYANQGPNNEVYLTNGQAIAFELTTNAKVKPTNVQIGAKLAKGSDVTLKVNSKEIKNITSATNMFYELKVDWKQNADGMWTSGPIVVSCEGADGSILSLTDMKVTSTNGTAFVASTGVEASGLLKEMKENVVLAMVGANMMESVLGILNPDKDEPTEATSTASTEPEEITTVPAESEGVTTASTDPEETTTAPTESEATSTVSTEPEEITTASTEPEEITTASTEPEEITTAPAESEEVTTASTEPEEITTAPAESEATSTVSTEPEEITTTPAESEATSTVSTEPEETTIVPTESVATSTVSPEPEETTTVPAESEAATTVSPEPEETITVTTEPEETTTVPTESTTTVTEPTSTSPSEYLYGDADLDGKVTIKDVTIIQKYAAKLISLDDKAITQADVSGDTVVTVSDATYIQKLIAKLIDTLPAEEDGIAKVGLTTKATSINGLKTAPSEGAYAITGSFNNWDDSNLEYMVKEADGNYTISYELKAGRYEFKFYNEDTNSYYGNTGTVYPGGKEWTFTDAGVVNCGFNATEDGIYKFTYYYQESENSIKVSVDLI